MVADRDKVVTDRVGRGSAGQPHDASAGRRHLRPSSWSAENFPKIHLTICRQSLENIPVSHI